MEETGAEMLTNLRVEITDSLSVAGISGRLPKRMVLICRGPLPLAVTYTFRKRSVPIEKSGRS